MYFLHRLLLFQLVNWQCQVEVSLSLLFFTLPTSFLYTLGACLSAYFVSFLTMRFLIVFLIKLLIPLPLWCRCCLFQGTALCFYVIFSVTLAGNEALVVLLHLVVNRLRLGKTTTFGTALFTIKISFRLLTMVLYLVFFPFLVFLFPDPVVIFKLDSIAFKTGKKPPLKSVSFDKL